MRTLKCLFVTAFVICTVLFSGCSEKGGNGNLASDYILNLTVDPEEGGEVWLDPPRREIPEKHRGDPYSRC